MGRGRSRKRERTRQKGGGKSEFSFSLTLRTKKEPRTKTKSFFFSLTSPASPLPPTASDVSTCSENACAFTASFSGGVPGPSRPCSLSERMSALPPREASPMPRVVPKEA